MKRKVTWLGLLSAAIVVAALYYANKAEATPPKDFTGTTIAQGRFGKIDVFSIFVPPNVAPRLKKDIWLSLQKTRGMSDLFVQSNILLPGGHSGWHSHPGHSLITVTKGTVTAYEGDDPNCKPHVYAAGMGFVDHGGDHAHIIRNEGPEEAATVAVQLIPADQPRRIDVPDPGNCPF